MNKYDITHDMGDLTNTTRRKIADALMDADGVALTPMQIQRRIDKYAGEYTSIKEIEATLDWMAAQPREEVFKFNKRVRNAYRVTGKRDTWIMESAMPDVHVKPAYAVGM